MERSPPAHSPDARDTSTSFRRPAVEVAHRNYRRHSPLSSRSHSPSPGSGKRERSPSYRENGTLKRGRNNDTDVGKGREDGRFRRATGESSNHGSYSRDRHGRAEGYDCNVNRRNSSYYDRSYQNSHSSHSCHDDGKLVKRTVDRSTRERNDEDPGYGRRGERNRDQRRDERNREERMNAARVPDRDKIREDETDVYQDKYKSKEKELCRGQDKYAERYIDNGSDVDLQQSGIRKRISNGIVHKDVANLEKRDHATDKVDGREGVKTKADVKKARDRERRHRGRDDGKEPEIDKKEGDGGRNRDKGYKGQEEHGRGSKGDTSDEHEDADKLSQQETSHKQSRGKKGDKYKKYSSEKGRSELLNTELSYRGQESGRSSEHSDETKRLDDNLKGSKWGPEADYPDPTAACSDPEVAKMAAMKAAALVNINLGSFKSLDEKRKMLWGSKDQKPAAVSGTNRWDTAQFADRDRQEKFNKLMGVKGGMDGGQGNTSNTFTTKEQEELQDDLEKQFTAGLRRRDGRTVGLGL